MKTAVIMDVQRYSIHDGPGIRTTVFFKGCHMACAWCHNPESQRPEVEMLFYEGRCIGCKSCLALCKRSAHRMDGGQHRVELALCRDCPEMAACAQGCPAGALQLCGQVMDAAQLLERVLADRPFYGKEGGVTCSGGEALLQDEFLMEFLPLCKENGISTCLDTTFNVDWERIEKLLPYVDWILADLKFMDDAAHRRYTGAEGTRTRENLKRLSKLGKRVILRMPLAAGVNDSPEEMEARREFLRTLPNVERVDCFAVTNHGAEKYRALQRQPVFFNRDMDLEALVKRAEDSLELSRTECARER